MFEIGRRRCRFGPAANDHLMDRRAPKAGTIRAGRIEQTEGTMISRIHSTTIAVSNQDAALDFYVNVLGWKNGSTTSWATRCGF